MNRHSESNPNGAATHDPGFRGHVVAQAADKRTRTDDWRPEIAVLMKHLGGHNGVARQRARDALIRLGESAVEPLLEVLSADSTILRWEAAKAFTQLRAPAAVPSLIKALEDKSGDVRWLAAEALILQGASAILPLLEYLGANVDSDKLREGAHHVIRECHDKRIEKIIEPVLASLQDKELDFAVPVRVEEAIEALRNATSGDAHLIRVLRTAACL